MRIAINGFGRIGRTFFRQAFRVDDIEIVAVNDLGDVHNLAYLLQYDSVYRTYEKSVEASEEKLLVDGKEVLFFQEKDPTKLPWKELRIDVVVESTGVFRTSKMASSHLDAGAKRVVITAPAKDKETPTATPNVGMREITKARITSNASCTTNATTPLMAIMMQDPGVEKAMLSTVHGYTASQSLVDAPTKGDFQKGRAAAVNIVPHTTGAAMATQKAIPSLEGKFDGMALRVPVVTGSVLLLTFLASRQTSVDEINDIFRKAATDPLWQGIVSVTETSYVSTDIIGSPYGSIIDLSFTRVVSGDFVKVVSWYDNEWGYCAMLLKHVQSLNSLL